MKIEDIDKNLVVETTITEPDLVWFDAKDAPFALYGVFYDEKEGRYRRVPSEVAEATSTGVVGLSRQTAGGRVRFRTDSPYIAIRAVMDNTSIMSHITLAGQSGFDIYRVLDDGVDTYYRTFIPPRGVSEGYSSGHFTDGVYRDYTINFPLYDRVKELYIALKRTAHVSAPTPYAHEKPVLYYGSSITQGGCASRPGNAYQAIISRHLSVDHINLGFSGSAKGETAMAEYIASLPMSVFVMDYDHNAPTLEHLDNTFYPFYRIVREKNPTLPIVFVSAPDILRDDTGCGRYTRSRDLIRSYFERARGEGDANVYFIDGAELFEGEEWDACTVDGTHPNDLGFYRMAMRIEKEIAPLVK